VLSAYTWIGWHGQGSARATTAAFVALVLIHPLQAMHCRSPRMGWWRLPANPLTWVSVVVLVALQGLAVSWSPLARLLGTMRLSVTDWLAITVAVVWPVLLLEAMKAQGRRRGQSGHSGDP
jgi:magnesium-transporting ATPase (P-type)